MLEFTIQVIFYILHINYYSLGRLVSGSSNACVEGTAGIALAEFWLFFGTGTNEDKTVLMIVESFCLFPSFGIETAIIAFAFAEFVGIPVEEFLL